MPGLLDLLTQGSPLFAALEQYPMLRDLGVVYQTSPRASPDLEYWPANEPGSSDRPRPSNMPMGIPGQEVNSSVWPIDILGDIVSHQLVKTDPTLKGYYDKFGASLTDDQKGRLRGQYQYSKENFGERRPYELWEEASGLPAYFRGYPFKQWDEPQEMYTPDQLRMLDEMMRHLGARK